MSASENSSSNQKDDQPQEKASQTLMTEEREKVGNGKAAKSNKDSEDSYKFKLGVDREFKIKINNEFKIQK